MRELSRVVGSILILSLAACGGGGGGSSAGSSTPPTPPVPITGVITGISQTGNAFQLTGWACAAGTTSSIKVQVYAGGSAQSGGTAIGTYSAGLASDASVIAQCAAGGSDYNFSIPLTLATQSNFGAAAIYVYGVPPGLSSGTQLLNQSGNFAVPQAIWFDPRDSYVVNSSGDLVPFAMADIATVFTAGSAWATARSHTQVMDFDTSLIAYGSDAQLTTIFTYLAANNIAFALDAEPLVPGAGQCGAGVEGFGGGPQAAAALAQRVKSLGGTIAYMDMDEPFYYGALYPSANGGCQYSVATVAQQTAAAMQAVRAIFPDVQVGDAEPLDSIASADPGWLADYQEFITAFAADAGFSLTFFHDDATWSVPLTVNVPSMQSLLAKNQIAFGMYFEGADDPLSDAAWMSAAEEHIQAYNSTGLAQPAQVLIDTWDPYPTDALPETSPTAMSYLVDFYFSPQAQLSPFASTNQDAVVYLSGAVMYRSTTCSLATLGAVSATPTTQVEYAYCLVQARAADAGGLDSFVAALDNGSITLQAVLDNMFNSPEFQQKFYVASMNNSQFVDFVFALLLFRAPTSAELSTYTTDLSSGADTQQQVFDLLLGTAEFQADNPILGTL